MRKNKKTEADIAFIVENISLHKISIADLSKASKVSYDTCFRIAKQTRKCYASTARDLVKGIGVILAERKANAVKAKKGLLK